MGEGEPAPRSGPEGPWTPGTGDAPGGLLGRGAARGSLAAGEGEDLRSLTSGFGGRPGPCAAMDILVQQAVDAPGLVEVVGGQLVVEEPRELQRHPLL